MNRGSTVGKATGYWMDSRGVGVLIPVGLSIFAPLHIVQTFYPMRALVCLARGGLSVKPTIHPTFDRGKENVDLYIHFPTSLWPNL
jgi:hypothetical protein